MEKVHFHADDVAQATTTYCRAGGNEGAAIGTESMLTESPTTKKGERLTGMLVRFQNVPAAANTFKAKPRKNRASIGTVEISVDNTYVAETWVYIAISDTDGAASQRDDFGVEIVTSATSGSTGIVQAILIFG
jgi:hypothetical protein